MVPPSNNLVRERYPVYVTIVPVCVHRAEDEKDHKSEISSANEWST